MEQEKVKDFYEQFPYPNKQINSRNDLLENAAWVSLLAGRKPNEFFKREKILEAGCGTGEFSCGFALGKARVAGIDISYASIKKAILLKKKFGLKNVSFFQADILENNLEKESFDFVFSMGAIHHTDNPELAFKKLAELVKPNGFIVVGLYNSFGRIPVKLKRFLLFALAGSNTEKRIALVNRLFHKNKPLTLQRKTWIADKYCHPLEKTTSIEEVLRWIEENNFDFFDSKPKIPKQKSLFYPVKLLFLQLEWMLRGESFFTVSGKKKAKVLKKNSQHYT